MGSPSEKKVAKKLASTCVDGMSKGHLSVKMHVKRQLFANIEWRGLHKHAKRKATCCHIDCHLITCSEVNIVFKYFLIELVVTRWA